MFSWPASSGYTQSKPYEIVVVGPDVTTARLVCSGLAAWLSSAENVHCDKVQTLDSEQSFTVVRQSRGRGDPSVRYSISEHCSALRSDQAVDLFAQIRRPDAYLVVIRNENRDDFHKVQNEQIDRVVNLCNQHAGGPRKLIMIVAHNGRPLDRRQGFVSDDMRAMMRRTNAGFQRYNLANRNQCAQLLDVICAELIDEYTRFEARERTLRAIGQMSATAGTHETDFYQWAARTVFNVQMAIFPRCTVDDRCNEALEADNRPAMSDADAQYHRPDLSAGTATPIGKVVQ